MNPAKIRRCVACFEVDCDLRRFHCGCFWCRDCLAKYLQTKLAQRDTWPPKCCEFIFTEEDVKWTQSSELLEQYRKVNREKQEPRPLYCSEPRCSELLNTQNTIIGSNIVVCEKCDSKTCKKCKQGHEPTNSECEEPPMDAALTATARSERWQTCPRCNRMLERTSGCNHMRCHCGHEFCYSCGQTWKTCNCGLGEENVVYE
ncbi:hypothetical protein K445DRAFT_68207, partial [Daldinia sp. EC12]